MMTTWPRISFLFVVLAFAALTSTACKETNSVDDAKAQVAQAKQQLARARADLAEAQFSADMKRADTASTTDASKRTQGAEDAASAGTADNGEDAKNDNASVRAAAVASPAPAQRAGKQRRHVAQVSTDSANSKRVCADCGTIASIEPVRTRNGPPEYVGSIVGGVVGAAIGNQIGDGSGQTIATIVGAVGGALAGHETQQRMTGNRAYRVGVNMDVGGVRTITVPSARRIARGQRVRVHDGNIVLMGAR